MLYIRKTFQTKEIVLTVAGEKVVFRWKSAQILVRQIDKNACNSRVHRNIGNHIAGVCPLVVLFAETTLAQELHLYLKCFGRQL